MVRRVWNVASGPPTGATAETFVTGASRARPAPSRQASKGGAGSTTNGNKDAYWRDRRLPCPPQGDAGKEGAPVFYVHGLQDYKRQGPQHGRLARGGAGHRRPLQGVLANGSTPGRTTRLPQATASPTRPSRAPTSTCRNDWWNATLVGVRIDRDANGHRTPRIYGTPPVQVRTTNGTWRSELRWPPADAMHGSSTRPFSAPCRRRRATGVAKLHDYHKGDPPTRAARCASRSRPRLLPRQPWGGPSARSLRVRARGARHRTLPGIPWYRGNVSASGNRAAWF